MSGKVLGSILGAAWSPDQGLALLGHTPAPPRLDVLTSVDICIQQQSFVTFTHFYEPQMHINIIRFNNSILSGADMSAAGRTHRLYGSHVIAKGQ